MITSCVRLVEPVPRLLIHQSVKESKNGVCVTGAIENGGTIVGYRLVIASSTCNYYDEY